MKYLPAFVLSVAGLACAIPSAMASTGPDTTGQAVKNAAGKKTSAAKNTDEPDIKGLLPTAFDCELGNKLTIYSDANDDQQIALHWNKRLHRMTRVSTTTGAQRFENAANGLVWIGIPAKGMLLDAKKGKQLANECRSKEQKAQQVAENG